MSRPSSKESERPFASLNAEKADFMGEAPAMPAPAMQLERLGALHSTFELTKI